MTRAISKRILTGLITILPVVLTLYLLYWLVVSTEALLGNLLRFVLPIGWYFPGMGFAAGLLVAFVVGLLMHTLVVRRLFAQGERAFIRLPVVKSIYLAIRDLLNYFSSTKDNEFQQVVAVSIGDTGMELIGFVTRTNLNELPKEVSERDYVLVYFPMSYMIGGYAALTPRSALRPLNMSMEDAMRFILTAGVTGRQPTTVEKKSRA